MRQIKAWFGWHERARSGPAARDLDGSRAIGCQKSCPLCQEANKANVVSPRSLARRPLAANCCAVDVGGPESCNAPTGGVLEGVCLRLDLGEQRGIFSRPKPTTGAPRPHEFRTQHPERGLDADPGRTLTQFRAPCASAVSGASWPVALCTHPPLRRERRRCAPTIAFNIEANRGGYERQ